MTARSSGALLYQPNLWSDESVVGSYQIRLREANRLPTLDRLAAVFGAQRQYISSHRLFTEPDGLQLLELACGETLSLRDAMPQVLHGASGPLLRGARGALSIQFWMTTRAQVCVECLRQYSYLDTSLDFWHLPVCAEHQRLLLDRCSACGSEISLDRQSLFHCQSCGADLREATAAKVEPEVSAASAKLSALSPVPLLVEGEESVELNPNELAAFVAFFASGEYIEQEAHKLPGGLPGLPASARVAGLQVLVRCMTKEGLNLALLREQLVNQARYMRPFRETPMFPWWLLSHLPPVQLGIRPANALAHGTASDVAHMAAHQGTPVSVRDLSELASCLGTDACTAKAVAAFVGLAKSRDDLAFDADDVLQATIFFNASLSERELDESFGIEGLTARLTSHQLVKKLSSHGEGEMRVSADSIIDLLRRLDRAVPRCEDTSGHSLGTLDGSMAGDQVALLLAGAVQPLRWRPPHRLADLVVQDCRRAQATREKQ